MTTFSSHADHATSGAARHFSCSGTFIHSVDSVFDQHAKWLRVTRGIPWRRPIASLDHLLTSLVWRQDQNGFSPHDRGGLDVVVHEKAAVIRIYRPPGANTLLHVMAQCLRSRHTS